MATVNRQHIQLNELSYDDIDYKYFSYTQWKGMNDDKNYIGVDQETFHECNNVYIDESGVLKSRPAVKVVTDAGLQTIVDAWVFGDFEVYKIVGEQGQYQLIFRHNDTTTDPVNVPNEFVLTFADEKIFMFAENTIAFFDTVKERWYHSDDDNDVAISTIYVPHTIVSAEGVDTQNEELNELTSAKIFDYIYQNASSIDYTEFDGEFVTIKIANDTYKVTFNRLTPLVLVKRGYSFKADYESSVHSDAEFLGTDGQGIPLIDATDNGILLSRKREDVFELYFSIDGLTFKLVDVVTDILYKPLLSKDSTFIAILKQDGPYVKSVIPSTANLQLEFPQWTNLFQYCDYTDTIDIDMSAANAEYKHSTTLGAVFYDSGKFAIAYGNLPVDNGDKFTSHSEIKVLTYSAKEWRIKTLRTDVSSTLAGDCFDFSRDITTINENLRHAGDQPVIDGDQPVYNWTGDNLTIIDGDNTLSFSGPLQYQLYYYSLYQLRFYLHGAIITFDAFLNGSTYTHQILVNSVIHNIDLYRIGVDWPAYGTVRKRFKVIDTTMSFGDFSGNVSLYIDVVLKLNGNAYDTTIANIAYVSSSSLSQLSASEELFKPQSINMAIDTNDVTIIQANTSSYSNIYAVKNSVHLVRQAEDTRHPLRNGLNSIINTTYLSNVINGKVVISNVQTSQNSVNVTTTPTSTECYQYELIKVYSNKIFITSRYYTQGTESIQFVIGSNIKPLYVSESKLLYISHLDNSTTYTLYSNYEDYVITISKEISGELTIPKLEYLTELSRYFASSGKNLYISSQGAYTDGKFKWYFPKINTKKFNYPISALHPISTTEVAVFLEHSIYYVTPSENGYLYYKSRIPLGCMKGSDIITSYDGKYTIFSTLRGLVAMSYQDFVSATEQSLSYLSDNIFMKYTNWAKGAIKLCAYNFWLIVYKQDSNECYVYDLRNGSWWPMQYSDALSRFIVSNYTLKLVAHGNLCELYTGDDEYSDTRGAISWMLQSQKLHLNAMTYYKTVVNMIFNALSDSSKETTFNLDVINYRNSASSDIAASMNYKLDTIRTLVKRLNYSKVNEFQFKLSSDDEAADPLPLSLTNITIKYKLTGQVK